MCLTMLASLALNRVPLQYRVLTCGILLKANVKGQFVSGRPGGGETAQILKIQNVNSPTEATVINAAIDMDEQVHLWPVGLESDGYIPTQGRAESYGHSIFSFFSPQWLLKFSLLQLVHKGSCLLISSIAFAVIVTRVMGDESRKEVWGRYKWRREGK